MNEVRGWKCAAEIIVANFGSKVCYANARAQSVSLFLLVSADSTPSASAHKHMREEKG